MFRYDLPVDEEFCRGSGIGCCWLAEARTNQNGILNIDYFYRDIRIPDGKSVKLQSKDSEFTPQCWWQGGYLICPFMKQHPISAVIC